MGEVRIGTSGWSYPSGAGTWNGIFYPLPGERPRGFYELGYYAEHFDTVEVNVTFYRPPSAGMTARWARETPRDFDFSLKLHQSFTHAEPVRRRVAPPRPEETAGEAPAASLPEINRSVLEEFRRGIEPLASSGKLGALLAQFPPGFKESPESRDYLARLLRTFREHRVAVELRHRSWSDAGEATLALLGEFNAALVQIDEPKFRFSIRQDRLPNEGSLYYMRLHGRNRAKWWRHDSPDDRYDYLYSAEELRPFATTVEGVRRSVEKAYVFMNNHFSAKAIANAAALKGMLGEPLTGKYRQEFLARYPEVAALKPAAEPATSLFEADEDREGRNDKGTGKNPTNED